MLSKRHLNFFCFCVYQEWKWQINDVWHQKCAPKQTFSAPKFALWCSKAALKQHYSCFLRCSKRLKPASTPANSTVGKHAQNGPWVACRKDCIHENPYEGDIPLPKALGSKSSPDTANCKAVGVTDTRLECWGRTSSEGNLAYDSRCL